MDLNDVDARDLEFLSPVAEQFHRPSPTPISSRLTSLDGARIAFIDNSFASTAILHDELKRALATDRIVPTVAKKKYWRQLDGVVVADLARRCDAVITGICTTPPSTTWGAIDSIAFERLARPTVTLVAALYESVLAETAAGEGMSQLRYVVLPYPIEGTEEHVIRAAARAVVPAIRAALTS